MRAQIHIPADFAEHATELRPILAERYGVSPALITKWRKRIGVAMIRGKVPSKPAAGFKEKALLLSVRQLCIEFSVCCETVRKWRIACGVPPKGRYMQPAPADFAGHASQMLLVELTEHYGRDRKTIKRWMRETDSEPRPYRHASGTPQRRAPASRHINLVVGYVVVPSFRNMTPTMRGGREEEAAHFLRHYSAVYRCTERGGADQKGSHWRCGNAVLTAAELIERAERKGWDEHAWRRVA